MTNHTDIIIIGAGLTGAATAWQLAMRGATQVTVLERHGIASGTTGRSCAILRMHYTLEPLARMAIRSRDLFQNFDDIVGGDPGFRQVGWIGLANLEDAESLAANVAMQQEVGIDARVLEPDDVADLVPGMRMDDVGATAWEPGSGFADPLRTASAFITAARRKGVTFRAGVEVSGVVRESSTAWRVETNDGSWVAERVVLAAGFRTATLLEPHGVKLPLEPVRHTVAVVEPDWPSGRDRPIVSDRVIGNYYRPTTSGYTLIGSTGPYDGLTDRDTDLERWPRTQDIESLGQRLTYRFPNSYAKVSSGYTSIYDCTPDLQPLLGEVDDLDGISIGVGFSGHGFKIAPAIGEMLADDVLGGNSSEVDINMFRTSRFDEGTPIEAAHKYTVPTLG